MADGDPAFEHLEDAGVATLMSMRVVLVKTMILLWLLGAYLAQRLQVPPRLKHTTSHTCRIEIGAPGASLDATTTPHRELGEKHGRSEPCLHLDYAFLSDETGSDSLTVLIGKLEHTSVKLEEQNSTFACPVGEKDHQ